MAGNTALYLSVCCYRFRVAVNWPSRAERRDLPCLWRTLYLKNQHRNLPIYRTPIPSFSLRRREKGQDDVTKSILKFAANSV